MNPKTAQTIAAVCMLTFMLISGFYVANVPVWIAWMKYLSFLWYGMNLLTKIQYGGVTYYDCNGNNPSDPQNTAGCTPLTGAQLTSDIQIARSVDEWPWCV